MIVLANSLLIGARSPHLERFAKARRVLDYVREGEGKESEIKRERTTRIAGVSQ